MEMTGPNRGLVRRWLSIHSVPSSVVVLTAVASFGGVILGVLQAWPLWGMVLAALVPWIPLFTSEMVWTYRHYQWLALFYVLVVTQGGHFLEHVVQMVQIHVLGLSGRAASGVFGALNIEWVHFIWNSWVLVAVLLLLYHFRSNGWLWATGILAGWHELEHVVIMVGYLRTHMPGGPGLLARGGLIGGGLPLTRPDLHFIYNLIETTPLVIAFVYQLIDTYDEWVKRAFPHLSDQMLIETTAHLQPLRFAAGEAIVRQGEAPDRFYIISHGDAVVTKSDDAGQQVPIATLSAGQFFGEVGLLSMSPRTASVTAKTPLELLALDRATFQRLVANSKATAEDIAQVARSRVSHAAG